MITQEEVKHIAHLARIELMEGEEQRFEKELSAILEFVEKLKETDTEGVEPMTGGTNLENNMRRDEQVEKIIEGRQAELIQQMPDRKKSWLKVKSTFTQ